MAFTREKEGGEEVKVALITTTINVPRVLELYRKLGPDVRFFVALDQKSVSLDGFIGTLGNTCWLFPNLQARWKCSNLIGWNCIQRRNIALLEAVAWGADIIVSIDDDNIPLDRDYFNIFKNILNAYSFSGLKVGQYWFDPGNLLVPPARHRGFPFNSNMLNVVPVTGVRAGVAAGMCLGDPDVSAITRMSHPMVPSVTELARVGVVVGLRCWTVFNSQNTAFIRELAPTMFMPPGVGRYDDIFASLIAQRIMGEKNLHVHFGQPFIWQQRNAHNLLNDLKAEIFGMENIRLLADELDDWKMSADQSVLNAARFFYFSTKILPNQAKEAAAAFFEDLEAIL